jgi:hypothetical protein
MKLDDREYTDEQLTRAVTPVEADDKWADGSDQDS